MDPDYLNAIPATAPLKGYAGDLVSEKAKALKIKYGR